MVAQHSLPMFLIQLSYQFGYDTLLKSLWPPYHSFFHLYCWGNCPCCGSFALDVSLRHKACCLLIVPIIMGPSLEQLSTNSDPSCPFKGPLKRNRPTGSGLFLKELFVDPRYLELLNWWSKICGAGRCTWTSKVPKNIAFVPKIKGFQVGYEKPPRPYFSPRAISARVFR